MTTISFRAVRSNQTTIRRAAFGVALAAVGALAFACKPAPPAAACPATFKDLPADQQSASTITCSCKGNEKGSVWGSGMYTTDSNICAAALHAGATSSTGGNVTLKKGPGCPTYTGTVANGVTTAAWGSFDSSFYFFGKGNGTCGGGTAASGTAAGSAKPASSAGTTASAAGSAKPGASAAASSSAGGAPTMKK